MSPETGERDLEARTGMQKENSPRFSRPEEYSETFYDCCEESPKTAHTQKRAAAVKFVKAK